MHKATVRAEKGRATRIERYVKRASDKYREAELASIETALFTELKDEILKASHHDIGQLLLETSPQYGLNGFILAKAVRIAMISQPPNLEYFQLQESINADDFISSFILKACLFDSSKIRKVFF